MKFHISCGNNDDNNVSSMEDNVGMVKEGSSTIQEFGDGNVMTIDILAQYKVGTMSDLESFANIVHKSIESTHKVCNSESSRDISIDIVKSTYICRSS